MREKIKKILKNILGIHQYQSITLDNYLKNLRLKYGPRIWKQKICTADIINAMRNMGMKKGSNVFIHCSWNEFYNYTGSEKELIDAILDVIGKEGTLIMPAFPILRRGKIFNVKKSVTAAGLLAEEFRHYPDVKRSVNVQHSVCALGPQSDYLISEHHLSESCWDEKSPYYKLASINALVFYLGMKKYSIGIIGHCVESILRKEVPYYRDFYNKHYTEYSYVDVDNLTKSYKCFEISGDRVPSYSRIKKILKKYFDGSAHKFTQISNLEISVNYADKVIPKMIELAKRGIDIYKKPSKRGYDFKK